MDEVTDLDNISNLDQLLKVGDTCANTYSIGKGANHSLRSAIHLVQWSLRWRIAGNLIEDAKVCANRFQDAGIGTPATRDETIEKLIRLKYIAVDDQSQILTPDKIGYLVMML